MELLGNIVIAGQTISYRYRVHPRARRVRLSVTRAGLTVSGPRRFDTSRLPRLFIEKSSWITRQLNLRALVPTGSWPQPKVGDYQRLRDQAATLVETTIERFKHVYQIAPRSVSIRNQSTRWGSCSKTGRLNFNYRLIYLPATLVDYVIVHELCHLLEMNHSERFWNHVAQTIPDHRVRRRELRQYLLR